MERKPLTQPGHRHAATALRDVLGALLFAVIVVWSLGWNEALGVYVYSEQMLGAGLGLSAALALLAPSRGPVPDRGLPLRRLGALATIAVFGVIALRYPALQTRLAFPDAEMLALAVPTIAGILWAVWHRLGAVLPLLLGALAVFALWIGPELPASFATRPISAPRLAAYLAFDTNALLSRLLYVATITIAPFILFGALLNGLGAGIALTRPITRLVGGFRGGAAKVSVLSSAVFGTVSGSAVANVTTVGALTIPMMQRAGHRREEAAAIEAVASTGGQLMPPILGAASFLMAEFLGISYAEVALASLVPAILYFIAVFLAVDFRAGARPPSPPAGPERAQADTAAAPAAAWRYALPALLLVYLLFVRRSAPEVAALAASAGLLAVHAAGSLSGLGARLLRGGRLVLDAAVPVAEVILIAAAAALVLGLLNVTGAAFVLSLQMLAAGQGSVLVLLLLTAALALLLGLGMPTVGVYVLVASLAAPALVTAGIPPLSAHLFVLYFGMLSMITPPIALASFSAALIAGAPQWPTALAGVRIAAATYAVPLLFVLQPGLILPTGAGAFLVALVPGLLLIGLVTAAAAGHVARPLGPARRLLAAALALANLAAAAEALPPPLWIAAVLSGTGFLALHATPPRRRPR